MLAGSAGNLLFVQFGTFRDDWRRLAANAGETYQAQRGSVDFACSFADAGHAVTIVNVETPDVHDEVLPNRVRVVGLGPAGRATHATDWHKLLDRLAPDRVILRTPMMPVLAWVRSRRVRTLAVLADSFQGQSLRARLRRWRLQRALNDRTIEFVGNHGRNASRQLAGIGVAPAKIVPWDWAPARSPHDLSAKAGMSGQGPIRLIYAGGLSEGKGADDLLRAIAILAERGTDVALTLFGKGERDRLMALADTLGIAARADFAGLVPNAEVFERMRAADLVIVPSRHDYPEGLPLTIYEALTARTPIVASDHPMFMGNLVDGESAAVFPAGNAAALADRVIELAARPDLYARLSANSAAAWDRLQLPVTFQGLVQHWMDGDRDWIAAHSLAVMDYR